MQKMLLEKWVVLCVCYVAGGPITLCGEQAQAIPCVPIQGLLLPLYFHGRNCGKYISFPVWIQVSQLKARSVKRAVWQGINISMRAGWACLHTGSVALTACVCVSLLGVSSRWDFSSSSPSSVPAVYYNILQALLLLSAVIWLSSLNFLL